MNHPVHLSAAIRKVQPWKNGGGWTSTILEAPEGVDLDGLDWRVSIADIAHYGPFSVFNGMTRHLVALTGRVRLIGPDFTHEACQNAGPFSFPGEKTIFATPLAKPARVLNLMVRRGRFNATMSFTRPGHILIENHVNILVACESSVILCNDIEHQIGVEDGLLFTSVAAIKSDKPLIHLAVNVE